MLLRFHLQGLYCPVLVWSQVLGEVVHLLPPLLVPGLFDVLASADISSVRVFISPVGLRLYLLLSNLPMGCLIIRQNWGIS